jgi:hypothetical protein
MVTFVRHVMQTSNTCLDQVRSLNGLHAVKPPKPGGRVALERKPACKPETRLTRIVSTTARFGRLSCTSSNRYRYRRDVQTRVISLLFFRIQSSYPSWVHILQNFYFKSGILVSLLSAESLILLIRVPKSDQHALLFTMQRNSLIQEHGSQFHIPSSPLSEGYSV